MPINRMRMNQRYNDSMDSMDSMNASQRRFEQNTQRQKSMNMGTMQPYSYDDIEDSDSSYDSDSDMDVYQTRKYPSFNQLVNSSDKQTLQDKIRESMKREEQTYSSSSNSIKPTLSNGSMSRRTALNESVSRRTGLNGSTSNGSMSRRTASNGRMSKASSKKPLPSVFDKDESLKSSIIGENSYTKDSEILNSRILRAKRLLSEKENIESKSSTNGSLSRVSQRQASNSPSYRPVGSLPNGSTSFRNTESSLRNGNTQLSSMRNGTMRDSKSSMRNGTMTNESLRNSMMNGTSSGSLGGSSMSRSSMMDSSKSMKYSETERMEINDLKSMSVDLATFLSDRFKNIESERVHHTKSVVEIRLKSCLSFLFQYKTDIVKSTSECIARSKQVVYEVNQGSQGLCLSYSDLLDKSIIDFAEKMRICVQHCNSVSKEIESLIEMNNNGETVNLSDAVTMETKVYNCVGKLDAEYTNVLRNLIDFSKSLFLCFEKH